jgi:hypothetical protein
MACEHIKLQNGMSAIVCRARGPRPKPCFWCARPAVLLCDWKLPSGKTCDRSICNDHAQEVAPEKHLCPAHQESYMFWKFCRVLEGPRPQGGA